MKTLSDSEHDQDVTLCEWADVTMRLALVDRPENVVYGIPPGGMIAAGFLAAATNVQDPNEASVILVDVIRNPDEMASLKELFPGKEVRALFDQTATDRKRGWLVMPWESQAEAKPTTRGKSRLTDEEWSLWQTLTATIETAMSMPWPDPATAEEFYAHITVARALIEARPVERALLET